MPKPLALKRVYRRCRELGYRNPRLTYERNHRSATYCYVLYVCQHGRQHKRLWSTVAKPHVGCGCKTSRSSHEHRVQQLVEYLTGTRWSKVIKTDLRKLTGVAEVPHEIDLFNADLMVGIEVDGAQHLTGWGDTAVAKLASKRSHRLRDAAKDRFAQRYLKGWIRLQFDWLLALEGATDGEQLMMMRATLRAHGVKCRRDNHHYRPKFDLDWHKEGLRQLQELARSRGYQLLSKVYLGAGNKHRFLCPLHGEFSRKPSTMAHVVGGCRPCSITRIARASSTKRIARSRERFLALCGTSFGMVGTFRGVHRKVKCRCLEHGEVFLTLPMLCFAAGRVQGCKACRSLRLSNGKGNALRRERARAGFIRLLGTTGFTMVGPYLNANAKVRCRCRRHARLFLAMPTECLRDDRISGCPDCTTMARRKNGAKSATILRERAKAKFISLLGRDYKLAGEYRDAHSRVKCKCLQHGTQFSATPSQCLYYDRIVGCSICRFERCSKAGSAVKLRRAA